MKRNPLQNYLILVFEKNILQSFEFASHKYDLSNVVFRLSRLNYIKILYCFFYIRLYIFAFVNFYAHLTACKIECSSVFLMLDCLLNFQFFEIV